MPNQRSKNKVRLGGFLERSLYRTIIRMAKEEGMQNNKFGFAMKLVQEALEWRERRRKSKLKKRLKKGIARRHPKSQASHF